MRSVLTRSVFRALLANEPLGHPQCIRRSRGWHRSRRGQYPNTVPQRPFFGFWDPQPAGNKRPARPIPTVDPGLIVMKTLADSRKGGVRVPLRSELVTAFVSFFKAHDRSQRRLTPIKINFAFETFEHLRLSDAEHSPENDLLPREEIMNILAILTRMQFGPDCYEGVRALATGIYTHLVPSAGTDISAVNSTVTTTLGDSLTLKFPIWARYVELLEKTGDAVQARDLCFAFYDLEKKFSGFDDITVLRKVLQGLSQEGKTDEVLRTLQMIQDRDLPFPFGEQTRLIVRLARLDNFDGMKKIYETLFTQGRSPTTRIMSSVLHCCIRTSQVTWGEPIFKQYMSNNPGDLATAMRWAAAQGRKVDEVNRMIEVFVQNCQGSHEECRPTTKAFNDLISDASLRNDPYSAERYLTLLNKWNLEPDRATYFIQIEYRLKADDLAGAVAAYRNLDLESLSLHPTQAMGVGTDKYTKTLQSFNRLLNALCYSETTDYDLIMSVSDYMAARDARLEPQTIGALIHMFLQRDEFEESSELLRTTAETYSAGERIEMQRPFIEFFLDQGTTAGRAWDSYELYRKAFPEAPIEDRTKIMKSFFARKRSDLAVLVFGHMRQAWRLERRPLAETYIQCFQGIASCAHESGLRLVHNMLKLDQEVELETRLLNSLGAAYAACKMPDRSLQYYQQILDSNEGPNYSTFAMAFRACETAASGNGLARSIWKQMKTLGVEITRETYIAYIGAMASQGQFVTVVNLIQNMEADLGTPPDALVISTFYNMLWAISPFPDPAQQQAVSEWAKENYPQLWEELQKGEKWTDETWDIEYFKIDRSIEA